MKKKIKLFLKEIVPIIFGILIALYINNWNENSKNEKYIEQMISSINIELKETNEDIKETIPFQNKLIDTLEFYKNDDRISILDAMMKTNGVQIPSIKVSSWKAISNSRIELMEYSRVSALASIEDLKEILESKTQLLLNFIYPNVKETGVDKKELVILMIRDIIFTELDIQQEIEEIVEY